jgi:ribosomal protein RSM22 (predicted rRNA methylase)
MNVEIYLVFVSMSCQLFDCGEGPGGFVASQQQWPFAELASRLNRETNGQTYMLCA